MKNKQLKKLIKGKKKKYTWKTKEIIMLQLLWYLGPLLISLAKDYNLCLLYTSPSPRDRTRSRMPSSA